MTEPESQAEEIAKYKRVLSLARSSLEANQATIAAKDQQIAQLIKALEEEKSNNKAKRTLAKEEEAALVPRRILCRVDIEDSIWILIEYEEFDDAWKRMDSEQDLDDFIQRVPGVPLVCPTKCLSAEESNRIIEESKKRVERIVEEFRRYKVRTEISKKQKDAELRPAVGAIGSPAGPAAQPSYGSGLSGALERALTLGSIDHAHHNGDDNGGPGDEISRLRATLAEQEVKWKKLYEGVAKENEILRSKGGESLLATQWRARYESCMKEKEELQQRLELYTSWTNAVNASGKSIEQAYVELQEEFGTFRKKLAAIDRRRLRTSAPSFMQGNGDATLTAGGSSGATPLFGESEVGALLREYEMNAQQQHLQVGGSDGGSPRVGGRAAAARLTAPVDDSAEAEGGAGMTASKIKYVRHMILQYLSCREPEVRLHMETALMAIFRMTPEEREVIESKRREEATDTLSSITSFLGSLGT